MGSFSSSEKKSLLECRESCPFYERCDILDYHQCPLYPRTSLLAPFLFSFCAHIIAFYFFLTIPVFSSPSIEHFTGLFVSLQGDFLQAGQKPVTKKESDDLTGQPVARKEPITPETEITKQDKSDAQKQEEESPFHEIEVIRGKRIEKVLVEKPHETVAEQKVDDTSDKPRSYEDEAPEMPEVKKEAPFIAKKPPTERDSAKVHKTPKIQKLRQEPALEVPTFLDVPQDKPLTKPLISDLLQPRISASQKTASPQPLKDIQDSEQKSDTYRRQETASQQILAAVQKDITRRAAKPRPQHLQPAPELEPPESRLSVITEMTSTTLLETDEDKEIPEIEETTEIPSEALSADEVESIETAEEPSEESSDQKDMTELAKAQDRDLIEHKDKPETPTPEMKAVSDTPKDPLLPLLENDYFKERTFGKETPQVISDLPLLEYRLFPPLTLPDLSLVPQLAFKPDIDMINRYLPDAEEEIVGDEQGSLLVTDSEDQKSFAEAPSSRDIIDMVTIVASLTPDGDEEDDRESNTYRSADLPGEDTLEQNAQGVENNAETASAEEYIMDIEDVRDSSPSIIDPPELHFTLFPPLALPDLSLAPEPALHAETELLREDIHSVSLDQFVENDKTDFDNIAEDASEDDSFGLPIAGMLLAKDIRFELIKDGSVQSTPSTYLFKRKYPRAEDTFNRIKQEKVDMLEETAKIEIQQLLKEKLIFSVVNAEEGIYTVYIENTGNEPFTVDIVFILYEGNTNERIKEYRTVELTPGLPATMKFLMPDTVFWDDEEYFSGSAEDSDSVTKFNYETGLVWKEWKQQSKPGIRMHAE